uniref:Uncharacterized protein n=1 Tax=Scophthalmus maximus TaxID=52904 RepID=A0A8D3AEJ6_SCOMX
TLHSLKPAQDRSFCVYLCMLWTPPSIWADVVLFSNFRSPEYIMALWECTSGSSWHQCLDRSAGFQPAGSCPWRPRSPCHGISSELRWWQPAETPSSLEVQREVRILEMTTEKWCMTEFQCNHSFTLSHKPHIPNLTSKCSLINLLLIHVTQSIFNQKAIQKFE